VRAEGHCAAFGLVTGSGIIGNRSRGNGFRGVEHPARDCTLQKGKHMKGWAPNRKKRTSAELFLKEESGEKYTTFYHGGLAQ